MISLQENVEIKHTIISGLSKVKSQKEVHRISLKEKDADVIIKMDADMVPVNKESVYLLSKALYQTGKNRLSVPVLDFFTNDQLMGIHAIRPFATPKESNIHESNTDGWITCIDGLSVGRVRQPLFNHGFNPSKPQAVRFGMHRALKAKNFVGFHPHWVVINKVFKNFINSRDRSLEYSLKSIIMILNNEKYNWDILDTNQASNKKFMEDLEAFNLEDFLSNYYSKTNFLLPSGLNKLQRSFFIAKLISNKTKNDLIDALHLILFNHFFS